ncbi:hypothetical protein [Paenibacillus agilis]|uniref:Uncharacterized protein n=1 Tax=Paenibacillus agilis TaxID=3020863 RepID=A0A559J0X7_9BACL|nr:hypothetical protein [Paenibacillus agilis]TVX93549.1 hypothetical protein FPZ44_11090 [Paenibacillus agilis]
MFRRNSQSSTAGRGGFILIVADTMHQANEAVVEKITILVLQIADATANQIKKAGLQKLCY